MERSGHIVVVYLGFKEVIEALIHDFTRSGASFFEGNKTQIVITQEMIQRLKFLGETSGIFNQAKIFFYNSCFEAAQAIPQYDPDIVILDERRKILKTTAEEETGAVKENADQFIEDDSPNETEALFRNKRLLSSEIEQDSTDRVDFETFQFAIRKFTPTGYYFPMGRLLVILPPSLANKKRVFELGSARVQGVLTEPKSSVALFMITAKRLLEVRSLKKKSALCLSGGGLEGYLYLVGALKALDAICIQHNMNDFDIYCGASSGSIAASFLSLGVPVVEQVHICKQEQGKFETLAVNQVYDLASEEFTKRAFSFLKNMAFLEPGRLLEKLAKLVPSGFFRGDKLKEYLERQVLKVVPEDHFKSAKKELYISATDQDTGQHVTFGEEPWRDLKLSQAIRASCGIPPFCLPESINGHWFTDGQLTSSSDFNLAIRKGAGFVVLIDPLVPYTTHQPGKVHKRGGYFAALQAIKSLIQTRMDSMLRHARDLNPDVDFVVFQPTDEIMEAMSGNPMHYKVRSELVDIAYKDTLKQVLLKYESKRHKFEKHGFKIRTRQQIQMLLKNA